MARRDIRRYSAARSEFGAPFLNGAQKSVNRKVLGSNPCSGAKLTFKVDSAPLLEMMRSRFG